MRVIESGKPVRLEPRSTYEGWRVSRAQLRYCVGGSTRLKRNDRISGCVVYAIAPLVSASLKCMLLRILYAVHEPSEVSIVEHLRRSRLTATTEHVRLVERLAHSFWHQTGLLLNGMPNVWLIETPDKGISAVARRCYDGEWFEETYPLFGRSEFSRGCRLLLPRLPVEVKFPLYG